MVLDASGNGMGGTEIEPVLDLYRLETLNLADNDIEEMAQVRQQVGKGCLTFCALAKGQERTKSVLEPKSLQVQIDDDERVLHG